jgi:hypothetical protein
MARPLRIQYPGAYYHVMNQGNSRQEIFFADADREMFLSGLTESCDIYGIGEDYLGKRAGGSCVEKIASISSR